VELERRPLTAYSESVEGFVLPRPVGGHPALDFCNTYAGWDGGHSGDYLASVDHLAVWAAGAGLPGSADVEDFRRRASDRPRNAAEALEEAKTFRAALRSVVLDPAPGAPWRLVRSVIEEAAGVARLELREGVARWTLPAAAGVRLPLLAIARSAEQLLTTVDLATVDACPGMGCGWLFVDRSGRRRWCTMATCGNRAKVRRFAQRRASESPRRRASETPRRRVPVSSSRGKTHSS
jgi:predicted RNA-binding Zn ribbon-like protein